MLGKRLFVNPVFGKDPRITSAGGGDFSSESGTRKDENGNPTDVISENNIPMLGNDLYSEWNLLGGYSFNKEEFRILTKDAAALCQYVYYDDTLRPSGDTFYHSETHRQKETDGWISFKRLQQQQNYRIVFDKYKELPSLFLELNKIFPNTKTYLERQRTGFNSDIFFLSKDSHIVLIAYVTEGSRPFVSMSTKSNNHLMGFVDWTGDWLLADVLQGVTGLSPQHTLGIQNAKKIQSVAEKRRIKLMFVGHSLGGGIAVSCAIATNNPAIVFDMAGLHFLRLLKNKNNYDSLLRQHNILSYYVEGELLSTLPFTLLGLKHNGNRYKIAYDKSQKAADKHGMINICRLLGLKIATRTETDKLIN